jgi:hypothetical protein
MTVYRPGSRTWYIRESTTNFATFKSYQWGASGDTPVPADYDGDALIDIATYRPSTGFWYILLSTANSMMFVSYPTTGVSTYVPVPADYDGDGKADLALFTPATGTWTTYASTTNYSTSSSHQWGNSSDSPINKRP